MDKEHVGSGACSVPAYGKQGTPVLPKLGSTKAHLGAGVSQVVVL